MTPRQKHGDTVEQALEQALAYLNLSAGLADPYFERNLNLVAAALDEQGEVPGSLLWQRVHLALQAKLAELHETKPAFQNVEQAEAVLKLTFERLLPSYWNFHRDLLFHQPQEAIYNAFFLARACEAVLTQQGPWDESPRIVGDAMQMMNDYVGYRPVAVLENDRKAEPYPHERLRPVPLYLLGVGAVHGEYRRVLDLTMDILRATPQALCDEAFFDPDAMLELAYDPRGYDFGHPVNRRPNYQFGEWDPHAIDGKGNYYRFVVRQVTLDALMDRALRPPEGMLKEEMEYEAAAVLAGVVLMSSGTCGRGPGTHDSNTSLTVLLPRIASYRDRFYDDLLRKIPGKHGKRLLDESSLVRQPFGGARQHLNRYLARLRAAQLQHVELAKLFAEMGYPEASLRQAQIIPVARGRMLSEICSRITTCHRHMDQGRLHEAVRLLPEMEDLLHRAIQCGAFVDPWNILGFNGQFSVFITLDSTVHDHRVDELIDLVEDLFTLHIRLASEAAAVGDDPLSHKLETQLQRLADWWDQFATVDISGLRSVSGQEALTSLRNISSALGAWHRDGAAAGDVAFWRTHVANFKSPKTYALVIEALLEKGDLVASMALLMQWISQVEDVPLQEARFSFHSLSVRWMQGTEDTANNLESWSLIRKFFDYLEANADAYWDVPKLLSTKRPSKPPSKEQSWDEETEDDTADDDENPFGAAYEGVIYRDSTADGVEGETMSSGGDSLSDDELMQQSENISARLRFLTTLATLWRTACGRFIMAEPNTPESADVLPSDCQDVFHGWFLRARANQKSMMTLLESLHFRPIDLPPGNEASLVEYDRLRRMKDALAHEVLLAYVTTARAALGILSSFPSDVCQQVQEEAGLSEWQRQLIDLQRRMLRGDVAGVRQAMPLVVNEFMCLFPNMVSRNRWPPLKFCSRCSAICCEPCPV